MSTLQRSGPSRPGDPFGDFFRSFGPGEAGSKYQTRLGQLSLFNSKSLVIDFDDLISFDPALARSVVEHPDDFIGYASAAATAQIRVEDPEYAAHVQRIFARFKGVGERIPLQDLGTRHLGKLVSVNVTISKLGPLQLVLAEGVFRCRRCREIIRVVQSGDLLKEPSQVCTSCEQRTTFELLNQYSNFRDMQEVQISEISSLQPRRRKSRRTFHATLEDDLVDTVQLKDKVEVTATVRIKALIRNRSSKKEFLLYLDTNYVGAIEHPDSVRRRAIAH